MAWQVQLAIATKFGTTKINAGDQVLPFTNICTPETYLLYSIWNYYKQYCMYMYMTNFWPAAVDN